MVCMMNCAYKKIVNKSEGKHKNQFWILNKLQVYIQNKHTESSEKVFRTLFIFYLQQAEICQLTIKSHKNVLWFLLV